MKSIFTLVLPGGIDEDKASKIIRKFKLEGRVQEGVLRWLAQKTEKSFRKEQS